MATTSVDERRYQAAWRDGTCLRCDQRPAWWAFRIGGWYECPGCRAIYCAKCRRAITSEATICAYCQHAEERARGSRRARVDLPMVLGLAFVITALTAAIGIVVPDEDGKTMDPVSVLAIFPLVYLGTAAFLLLADWWDGREGR